MAKQVESITILAATAAVLIVSGWFLRKKKRREVKSITITLPDWAIHSSPSFEKRTYKTDEDCMSLAIELSARNVKEKTGGPFGCAIFQRQANSHLLSLYAIGVNRVTALNNSTLHGEMVAIQFAQQRRQNFTLHQNDGVSYELFTSCSPCCQCLGGCFWSGISRMVCGATKEDAEAIGFDEGPVFEASYKHLKDAGIDVKMGVLRKEAKQVLQDYAKSGIIYNGMD